jgi:DNA invertase Pin-like site-specific DNA recombinase
MDQPTRLIEIIRVSKINGREGDGFIAPDTQAAMIANWASYHDVEIVGSYRELDKSGSTTQREGLQAALDRVWAGQADGIITASVDRYSRSLEEGLAAIRELNAEGKSFVAVREGIEPGMSSTSFGWLMLSFLLMLAEWQLRVIKENWLTARRTHIEKGIANHAAYGYVKNESRRLEPDPDTAEWVVYMFERRAQGASWTLIGEELDQAGVLTPSGGERWLWSRVRSIVGNRVYLGELRSCGDNEQEQFVNAKAHDALVSRKLWDRANAVTNATVRRDGSEPVAQKNTRRPAGGVDPERGSPFILTGIVRCASCGGRMNGYTKSGPGGSKRDGPIKHNFYYRCRTTFSWGTSDRPKCEAPAYVPQAELEQFVVDDFFERFTRVLWDDQTDVDRPDTTQAEEALQDARDVLDAFTDSPATGRSLKLNGQRWYDRKVEKFNDAIDEAAQVLQDALNAQTGIDLPAELERDWPSLSFDEQRGFLSDAFGLVAVWPANRRRVPVAERARTWARDEPGAPPHASFTRSTGVSYLPIDV